MISEVDGNAVAIAEISAAMLPPAAGWLPLRPEGHDLDLDLLDAGDVPPRPR